MFMKDVNYYRISKKLMYERNFYEQIQTDFSYDEDFYKVCERKMQNLDEDADQIRYIIEGGVASDRK